MSRSASITSWLTERSLKKAVCEASLWIPLTSFAARVRVLPPCWHHSWQGDTVLCRRSCTVLCGTGGRAVSLPHSSIGCTGPAATDAVLPSRWRNQLRTERPSLLPTQGAALCTLLCPRCAVGTHHTTVQGRRGVRTLTASRRPLPPTWAR